jgi:HK97 family phage major capsid protein
VRDQVEATIREVKAQRNAAQAEMDQIVAAVELRGSPSLTADEQRRFDAARDDARRLDDRLDTLEGRLAGIDESVAARSASMESARRYGGTATVRVNSEPGPYYKGGPSSFFADMLDARYSPAASDRILRHERAAQVQMRDGREQRAATTTSFAGLVVPQYLVDDFAPVARARRPFLDFVGGRQLPEAGMTLTVPRGSTGTVVVSQTSQGTAVASQDMVNTDLVVNVNTIAGQQDVSRQALDRGSNTDEEIMSDLAGAYTAELERQAFNGTGANNQHLGLLSETGVASVTVTSAQPVNQVRQLAQALSVIATSRQAPAEVIVMHPRRWAYWMQAADSQGRPLVTPGGGLSNWSSDAQVPNGGVLGSLYGLPVIGSANIPTTISNSTFGGQDVIIVTRASDLRLWEDDPMPRRVRFEETLAGNLQVKIVAWDYSSWSAGRYPSASVVLTGTNLRGDLITFGT